MTTTDGPRLASTAEMDGVFTLLDRCFRFDRGGMRARRPFAYDPDRPERHAVVVEDGDVVAHAAAVPQTLVAGPAEIDCPGIAGVATHPRHRGEGHMSALLEFWLDRLDDAATPLVELGGDRQRYGRFGFENGGREFRYRVTDRSLPATSATDVRTLADDGVLDVVREIHGAERHRVRRDRETAHAVLDRRGAETLATDDKSPAYLCVTRDRSEPAVVEFGGDADGVAALLGHVFEAYGVSSLTVHAPPNHPLDRLFRRVSAGWKTTLLRKLNVRKLPALLEAFEPQLAERWQRDGDDREGTVTLAIEGGDAVRIAYDDADLRVERAPEAAADVTLDRRAMTHFLFGFPDHRISERDRDPVLSATLPLAYYVWASERV